MGHAPSWMRKSYGKVKKFADGGDVEAPSRLTGNANVYQEPNGANGIGGSLSYELDNGDKLTASGGGSYIAADKKSDLNAGYRVGYAKKLDEDKELDIGTTGYKYKSKRGDETYSGGKDLDSVDVRYRDKDSEYGVGYSPEGRRVQLTMRKRF